MDSAEQNRRMRRMSVRSLVKPAIYVLLLIALVLFVKIEFFRPREVMVVPVQRGDVIAEVEGTGTVAVDQQASIGAKIGGRVERVFVDQGDFVHKGQLIAQLEDTDIRRDVQSARAHEQEARSAIQTAAATEKEKQAAEWQTKRAWEREQHLVATGAVSQEEADQYEEQYRTAASAVQAAAARIRTAQDAASAAKAEAASQQFNLSETKIFTYLPGVVVNFPKRPGDAIVPGEAVAVVADPRLTIVNANVDQRFSGKLAVGQPATVILRGRENQPLQGRVYRISPQADPAAEEMTVEVAFAQPPNQLQIGQWAEVYVRVGEAHDVLTAPAAAVMPMGNDRMILVAGAENKVRGVMVSAVASSPRSSMLGVTPLKGELHAGDLVIAMPMGVKPGDKIRPVRMSSGSSMPRMSGMPGMSGPSSGGQMPGTK